MADQSDTNKQYPDWQEYLSVLGKSGAGVEAMPDPSDPNARQAFYGLLVKSLASGVLSAYSDASYPDLVPSVNSVFNLVGTNPDFIYGYTKLAGDGVYRLSGYRGDGLFLMFDFMAGGLGVLDKPGPSVALLDVDKFTLSDQGEFDILLSETKPEGYEGDWFRLDPTTKTMNMRQASYFWGRDREARIAIERLDQAHQPQPLSASDIVQRLSALMQYPAMFAGFTTGYINNLLKAGFINRLQHDDWAGRGGVEGQHYYQGVFKLEPGQAIIIETALPETVRYWNIQLSDMLWQSIDWMNHQSSLNGGQAVLDSDGRFRAVIALEDPGVANWLDPAGLSEGTLMLRWNEASSGPEPLLRLVSLADLKAYLPADTHYLTQEQRQQSLRERRRAVQLRRRW